MVITEHPSCHSFVGISLFCQHLVVRIVDRTQDLSMANCPACVDNQTTRFASLHACQETPLPVRLSLFMPQVVTEILQRMDKLVQLFYLRCHYNIDRDYVNQAKQFVQQITHLDLVDRRYINEGTSSLHPYDVSWLDPEVAAPSTLDNNYCVDVGGETCYGAQPTNQQKKATNDLVAKKRKKTRKHSLKNKQKKSEPTPITCLDDLCAELFEACKELDE